MSDSNPPAPTSASLFRPEALAQQQPRWIGHAPVQRPPSLAWLTAACVAVALGLAAWLGLGEYTRKAQVGGVLVPDRGWIRLVAPSAGTVIERRVAEGQAVAAGDVLMVLALARTTLDAGSQAAVQRSLDERRRSLQDNARQQALLAGAERDSLTRRLRELQREVQQLDAEAALLASRLQLARDAVERAKQLAAGNFVSAAQVQTRSDELLAVQAQAQALQRQRAALAREQAEVDGELKALPLRERGRVGEIGRDLARLQQEAAQTDGMRQIEIRAPQAGTLTALAVEPGQAVPAGLELASLVPAGAVLQAQLYAPSRAVGLLRSDQAVQLRVHAYPHAQHGMLAGRVVQVSRTPLPLPESMGAPALSEPMYRITVALQPDAAWGARLSAGISTGLKLDADVLLERRRLVHWLFAPLLAQAQRSG
jgi:membrane fusion protein